MMTLLKDPNLHFCFSLVEEFSQQVNFLVAQEDCSIFGPLAT